MPWRTSSSISAISESLASRSTQASPMAYWRTAQWPTSVATFKPSGFCSSALRYSPCVVHSQGMPACKLLTRHGFYAHEGADQRVAALRFARRECETAVAGDDGGDAVFVRCRRERIPPKLRVEVGVKIDDTRSDGETADIEDAIGGGIDPANLFDPPIADRHIAEKRRHTRAVVNASAFENQIVHKTSSARAGKSNEHSAPRQYVNTRTIGRRIFPCNSNIDR